MLFTYWTGSAPINESIALPWRSRFPRFRIFQDEDVLPLLDSDDDRRRFLSITIPACKSDVARLCLLREYGGFYFDAHVEPTNADILCQLLDLLSHYELVIFDKTWEHTSDNDVHVMNSVLGARRQSGPIDLLVKSALKNLSNHFSKEAETSDYVPYNIYILTGPWDLALNLVDRPADNKPQIKEALQKQVYLFPMRREEDYGFRLYANYTYRQPNTHWSERQKHERLFGSAANATSTNL